MRFLICINKKGPYYLCGWGTTEGFYQPLGKTLVTEDPDAQRRYLTFKTVYQILAAAYKDHYDKPIVIDIRNPYMNSILNHAQTTYPSNGWKTFKGNVFDEQHKIMDKVLAKGVPVKYVTADGLDIIKKISNAYNYLPKLKFHQQTDDDKAAFQVVEKDNRYQGRGITYHRKNLHIPMSPSFYNEFEAASLKQHRTPKEEAEQLITQFVKKNK